MRAALIYGCLLLLLTSGCNVSKYLPAGERLYAGATVAVERKPGLKSSEHQIKRQLQTVVRPVQNTFLFKQPYKVWWWYVIGEPKKHPRGVRAFVRRILGEPPVLSSQVNAAVTAQNMRAYLENVGYFHSSVTGDTSNTGYFTKAVYKAKVSPQYSIRKIEWIYDSSDIIRVLTSGSEQTNSASKSLLKTGQPYRVNDLQAETERLDLLLKTKGYYYFSPQYIMLYADSTIGNNEVDLFIGIKNTTPEVARHAYRINRIMVFPNYTLLQPPPDTSRAATDIADGLLIRDTVHHFKQKLFERMITYRPGDTYSSLAQNTSLNRLINVGAFKFVKNRFEPVKDSVDPYKLNAYYYLTAARKKSLQATLDGFSKESKYLGAQASINWKHRNVLGGSQQLNARLYGSFELSFNDSARANNNLHAGTEVSINFPQLLVPFFRIKERKLYPVRTQFLLGYEYFNRMQFYSKNIYRFSYELLWKNNPNRQQVFAPFTFTHIHAVNVQDSFYQAVNTNPGIAANLYNENIMGAYYTYTFNTLNPLASNQWFFTSSAEAAGTIAGLLAPTNQVRSKRLFGTPFAQYVKLDADLRYTHRFRNRMQWASRFQIGAGMPYGNSNVLPFSKQYVIGGGSSLRAFSVRSLGPGSFRPTGKEQVYYQTIGGDYKILLNTELRIPLFERVETALFVDIGNTWTSDSLLFGRAGQLKADWYKELAVASGVGLRVNAGIVLLRLDVALRLRTPYLPESQRWLFSEVNLGSGSWRSNNLVFNLALGYPF